MAINLVVLAVTLLMAGFVGVWCLLPRLRPWMEAPKHRVLTWERRFPGAVRPAEGGISENRPGPTGCAGESRLPAQSSEPPFPFSGPDRVE